MSNLTEKEAINEFTTFLGRMAGEEEQIAEGCRNAYSTIAELAFDADSIASLYKDIKILRDHAISDMDKDYMVCYGERKFYDQAATLFERALDIDYKKEEK